ncbi:heavy metal-associated isoprenylated plant protein 7-like [Panicum hallii]|uniref:heavy metal-associated isoprenylated plant protein 7-like n=1 Tax=Panicum hallii TaxID=206008 RepID=UPI000DF4CE2E|nr:heavy metal-associated isoprenylated plant protein 7-like [Panicum hallii]
MDAQGTKPEGGGDGGAPKAAGKGGGDVPAAAAAGEEVVISAPVHCVGCARKLRRSLQRLDGVGEVIVDSMTDRVVLRGPKAAENAAGAVKVVERRTGGKAVLVSPAPEKLPPPAAAAKGEKTKKDDGGNKDVTNELPEIDMKMVVVLRINLHCDACCEEIKRRILRIKGVEDAVPHLKSSQMMVKGVVEPATLVGFIHNRTGRKAAIFRAEPLEPPPAPKSPPKDAPPVDAQTKKDGPSDNNGEKKDGQENGNKEEEPQEEKKGGGGGEDDKNPKAEKQSGRDGAAEEQEEAHGGAAKDDDAAGDGVVLENHKKDDRLFTVPLPAGVVTVAPEVALDNAVAAPYCYSYSYPSYYPYAHPSYHFQYPQPYYPPPYAYAGGPDVYGCPRYPPEAFTEENPNACAIV